MFSMEPARARLTEAAVAKDKPVNGLRVDWDVTYVPRDHAMRITYDLRAAGADVEIVHLWATNLWIHKSARPEDIPEVTNFLEFDVGGQVRAIKGALFDSKWQRADKGQRYRAVIAGVCRIGDGMEDFFYSREYEFPAW